MGLKLIGIFMLFFSLKTNAQTIEDYRENYISSINDKTLCENMIKRLEKEQPTAKNLAYLGVYQAAWANHTYNPYSKLKTFNKGKKNIQHAVSIEPNDLEIRILRYSVQANAPEFLGFNKELNKDKVFIKANKEHVKNVYLKQLIKDL